MLTFHKTWVPYALINPQLKNSWQDKQRAKVKERIDKFVKEKLLDFCDVLNIQINKTNMKKVSLL